MKPIQILVVFVLGLVFGVTLSRSGAADYDFIQKMFLFEDFQLYGIIASAVMLTAPGLYWLKRHGKAADGSPIQIKSKLFHGGTVYGGICFGIGWAITGMCPGPILVNVGEGKLYALAALAGTLVGAYFFGAFYPKLQPVLGMPPLEEGPGEG
ncbi:MAG TPA: YeeE/YedE family protein [Myxococcales bacterium]|nr:YeeE/YedE family protein [Myxococcales bacterium]HIN86080.1 YeeE/YedE family protein [Myxococcales bacterium]